VPAQQLGLSVTQLAFILGLLSAVGPFAIDTYLPAFPDMARELKASDVQMQLTLTAYLAMFAVMNLFHGALSDAIGRRTVILCGMSLFVFASFGAATSQSIEQLWFWRALQGFAGGAGSTVGRAVVRDLTEGAAAQRLMSQAMMAFAIAPAVAPIIGGMVLTITGWRGVFVLLGLIGSFMVAVVYFFLPESLPREKRQALNVSNLMEGYLFVLRQGMFWRLALASSMCLTGFLIYVFGAPNYLINLLGVAPQGFAILFIPLTLGTLVGSAVSSKLASTKTQIQSIQIGLSIAVAAAFVHGLMSVMGPQVAPWAFIFLPIYTAAAAMTLSPLNVLLLDVAPDRKGMVSSCQAFVTSCISALSAAVMLPFIWGSTWGYALTTFVASCGACIAFWLYLRRDV
jgi:MFS transporter, DHA1 family, multidrug resistance protein